MPDTPTIGQLLLDEFVQLRAALQQVVAREGIVNPLLMRYLAGRSQATETEVQAVIATPTLAAKADPRRWAVGFTASTNGTFLLSTKSDGSITRGFRIADNDDKFLTIDKHLSLPMQEWVVTQVAGPADRITVWECILLDG